MHFPLLCIAVLVAAGAQAQEGAIAAPMLSYVRDAVSLRPVFGIPGTSLVGDPLDLPWPIAEAQASPEGHAVILTRAGEAWLVSGDRIRRIPGLTEPVSAMALSPSGAAAVFRNHDATRIEIVTGLPDHPVVARRIDDSPTGPLAISDDGAWLLAAASGAVYLFDPASQIERIADRVLAMSFRPRSREFALTVNSNLVVWRDRDASYLRQWSLPDGVHSAREARFSNDGRQLWIANADGALLVADRDGGTQSGACHCSPDGLQPLAGGAVGLTGFSRASSSTPMRLATAGPAGLHVFFVPPAGLTGSDQIRGDQNR
jgi:hypothetical protein